VKLFMPLVWSTLLVFVLSLAQASSAFAEPSSTNTPPPANTVEELISILKSQGDREALIQQLEALQQTQEEPPSALDEIAESIEEQVVDELISGGVLKPLQELGIAQGQVMELLILSVAALAIVLIVWLNGQLAAFWYRRLSALKRHYRMDSARFHSILRVQRWTGYLVGLILFGYVVLLIALQLVGSGAEDPDIRGMLSTTLVLALIWLVVSLIWEGVNALLEIIEFKNRRLKPSRLQTITPVIRNVLLFFLSLFASMLFLSELGIDIMPLLAGAGVLGIAIGFGAQTMVKDFLNGAVIIFEDLLQIGDVVQLSDRFGVVERISIRKIQLRDLDGTVYTIPFGEIGVVANLTKDYSYYLMDVGVAYREDVDEVIACLSEVAAELRQDDDFSSSILDDLEVLGVDRFADSAVIIKARIMTKAHDKWMVGREFNRRMKAAFDERNIEIPFPHQTLYFGEDKSGDPASSAKVELVDR